jgi:hypothetical protein
MASECFEEDDRDARMVAKFFRRTAEFFSSWWLSMAEL